MNMNFLHNILVAFTLAGALCVVGYFTIISDEGPFAEEGSHLVIYLDHAQSLQKGARVTLLGIPIGRIENIDLISIEEKDRIKNGGAYTGHKVAVTVGVNRTFAFYEDYRIQVKNESLLENKVIFIDPGSAMDRNTKKNHRALPVLFVKNDDLTGNESVLEFFLDRKKEVNLHVLNGESGKDPMEAVAAAFDENRKDVRRTVLNAAAVTGKINSGRGTAGLLVNDDELHYEAHGLVNEAEVVVRDMRKSSEEKREMTPFDSLFKTALILIGL